MDGQASGPPIGGGGIGAVIRALDWSASSLGPYESWPERLRSILDVCLGSPIPIAISWGPDLLHFHNDAFRNVVGTAAGDFVVGRPASEAWTDASSFLVPVVTRGETVQAKDICLLDHRGGSPKERFFTFSHSPVRDGSGAIVGVFTVVYETTDRVREEKRQLFLLQLGDMLRELTASGDIMSRAAGALGRHLKATHAGYSVISSDGLYVTTDVVWCGDTSVIENAGPRLVTPYGRLVEALYSGGIFRSDDIEADPRLGQPEILAAFARDGIRAILLAPLRKQGRLVATFFVVGDTPRPWSDEDVALTEEVAERTWSEMNRGEAERQLLATIDDLRRLQHEQQLLLGELQHRTRNLIGVVRSLAHQTFERCSSLGAGRQQFNDRLTALARVQALFAQSDDRGITIGDLVRLELDALAPREARRRITVDGPEVGLRRSSVQTLALAIHELATNALKYGAFRTSMGGLSVTWRTYREADGERLALDWLESGLDQPLDEKVAVPSGFGRELIEQALPYQLGARTRLEFGSDGVHCLIDVPLPLG